MVCIGQPIVGRSIGRGRAVDQVYWSHRGIINHYVQRAIRGSFERQDLDLRAVEWKDREIGDRFTLSKALLIKGYIDIELNALGAAENGYREAATLNEQLGLEYLRADVARRACIFDETGGAHSGSSGAAALFERGQGARRIAASRVSVVGYVDTKTF